jgi:hypothetical protein
MSIGDWIGVVSLVLVVPLGIISGLLTPRGVAYLERRKLLKTHRTKTQALIAYKRIEDFKSGKRDRYPSYILLAVGAALKEAGILEID